MVIVTELLLGGTLRKYLLNMRPRCLDAQIAVSFALDIARAMECLHSHGIIHRDLKPGKLFIRPLYFQTILDIPTQIFWTQQIDLAGKPEMWKDTNYIKIFHNLLFFSSKRSNIEIVLGYS